MVNNKKGTILAEMLVGFLVYTFVVVMMVQLISSLLMLIKQPAISEFDIAIKQVSWQISTSNRLYLQDTEYCYDYHDNQRCLTIKNNRLYLTPGTQIVLNRYDSIKLFTVDNQLIIKASKKGLHYEAIIYTFQP